LAERDGQITSRNQAVAERDAAIAERDGQIASLNQNVAERDTQIRELKNVASEQDERIRALDQILNKRELALNSLTAELGRITSSRSWKLTMPLRFAGRLLRGDWFAVQASIHSLRNAKGNSFASEEETSTNKDVVLEHEVITLLNKQNISLEQPPFCGKRILLVSYYCPSRAHAGGLRILDIYSLIKSAFPNVQIDLYTHKRPVIDWSYEDVEKIFDNIFLSPVEDLSLSGFNQLHKVVNQYDVIDLQFHQSAYDMESWRKVGTKIIFTPMESLLRGLLIALRYRDIFSMRKMLANIILAKEELMFARKADEVICVSEKDASSLRMFCHTRKVCALETAVSNIEFADAFDHRHEDITPELKQPIILYIAYFGSETNINALKWYLMNVHPLINNALPEYKLHVVGRGDLSIFKEYQSHSIEFIGEVPKLSSYIRGAKVGIAPAVNGGGFRGKINQYSIYGVPVVASKIAAKGLVYQDGLDIFITDQARLFAKQCIRLLRENDLNRAMGQRAREKAFAQYTWESKMDAIKKIYNLEVA
jgi:glycosyltransferase involved in cell wall biosynthesis